MKQHLMPRASHVAAGARPTLRLNLPRLFLLGCSLAVLGVFVGCAKQNSSAPSAVAPPAPSALATTPVAPPANAEMASALPASAAVPTAPFEGEGWQPMFDGHSLGNWREIQYAGRGEVQVESGAILLTMGSPFTGMHWTNEFPTVNYEIAFDAMRTMGSDFFCGLTVPVGDSHCSLIVGGWGGGLVGISSLDGYDASENETTKFMSFEKGRWYRIRLRVTAKRLEAWIGNEKMVNVDTTDRKIAMRPGDIELSAPLGLSAWQTGAAFREIKWRRVTEPAGPLR